MTDPQAPHWQIMEKCPICNRPLVVNGACFYAYAFCPEGHYSTSGEIDWRALEE